MTRKNRRIRNKSIHKNVRKTRTYRKSRGINKLKTSRTNRKVGRTKRKVRRTKRKTRRTKRKTRRTNRKTRRTNRKTRRTNRKTRRTNRNRLIIRGGATNTEQSEAATDTEQSEAAAGVERAEGDDVESNVQAESSDAAHEQQSNVRAESRAQPSRDVESNVQAESSEAGQPGDAGARGNNEDHLQRALADLLDLSCEVGGEKTPTQPSQARPAVRSPHQPRAAVTNLDKLVEERPSLPADTDQTTVTAKVSLDDSVHVVAEEFEVKFKTDLALVLDVTEDQITIDSISDEDEDDGEIEVVFTVKTHPEKPVSVSSVETAFKDLTTVKLAGATVQGISSVRAVTNRDKLVEERSSPPADTDQTTVTAKVSLDLVKLSDIREGTQRRAFEVKFKTALATVLNVNPDQITIDNISEDEDKDDDKVEVAFTVNTHPEKPVSVSSVTTAFKGPAPVKLAGVTVQGLSSIRAVRGPEAPVDESLQAVGTKPDIKPFGPAHAPLPARLPPPEWWKSGKAIEAMAAVQKEPSSALQAYLFDMRKQSPIDEEAEIAKYVVGKALINQGLNPAETALKEAASEAARQAGVKRARDVESASDAGNEDPAASLGLEGTAEEDAAAAKLQAIQRGRQDRARVAEMKEDATSADVGGTIK